MQLMSIEDLAAYLGDSKRTIYKYIASGDCPPYMRISAKNIKFDRADVDAWLESKKIYTVSGGKKMSDISLLNSAKKNNVKKYLQISTDEVYGSLYFNDPPFTEHHQLAPNSPYSASKASADLVVRAYYKSFNLPINITRCSNNYGPYQFPEKLIPLMINNALNDESLPIYGKGINVRDWLLIMPLNMI